MAKNKNLHQAKTAKNDEFYTQLTDIGVSFTKSQREGLTMKCLPEIPITAFPEAVSSCCFCEENMVSLSDYFGDTILVEPAYFQQGIQGSSNVCSVRETVVKLLEQVLSMLPQSITLKVYDAWRPVEVQEALFCQYYKMLKANNPLCSRAELTEMTRYFVSLPSYDIDNPFVHNTGGAIDLTLFDKERGCELDMGTIFDDFTEAAYTAHFEKDSNEKVRDNRRLLYWAMINVGFTNLPTEWWHFDYGDAFWSSYTKKPALYRGIL